MVGEVEVASEAEGKRELYQDKEGATSSSHMQAAT